MADIKSKNGESLLSDKTIANAVIKDKDYLLTDGKCLYLNIKAKGTKVWTIRYTVKGTRCKTTIGNYPTVSLANARKKRNEFLEKVADGINPIAEKKEARKAKEIELKKSVTTLKSVIDDYIENIKGGVSAGHLRNIAHRLEVNIVPFLGHLPIDEITHPQLLECIKKIESRGAIELAKRTLNNCEGIWRFAVSNSKASHNIVANIDKKTALAKIKKRNYPHITDTKELGTLLRAIDEYSGDYSTRWALKLLPLVFVRPANIRFMEWSEINLEKAIWSIPADKMKMKNAHVVPLSTQALEILRTMQAYSGTYKYVFVSPTSTLKSLSENTLNMGLMRLGYKDKIVSHGFRHTASTLLHENIEEHGFSSLIIEAQLAHVERNSVKAVYNKAEYLSQRKQLMQWWADYLDKLKAGA